MHPAKKFFYICAGLFLLALSFQMGVRVATAQTGSAIDGGAFAWVTGLASGWRFSGVEGRSFHAMEPGGRRYDPSEPIPGTARIIATDPAGFSVMLENGDVYQYGGSGWNSVGNLLGGAISVERHTLGQLKARFRDPAATIR